MAHSSCFGIRSGEKGLPGLEKRKCLMEKVGLDRSWKHFHLAMWREWGQEEPDKVSIRSRGAFGRSRGQLLGYRSRMSKCPDFPGAVWG